MAQRVLYEVPTHTLSYDYAPEWLYLDWHGHLDDESVMAGALKLLELLQMERCSKVLNDNTNISGIWADAAKWGAEEFFPMLHDAGCRHFGWVYSPDTYSKLSAELAMQHTTAGIIIMAFRNIDTATSWLDQM
ncbi:MAG: hypothetical protein JWR44_1334 [Hymenobacter sp.]|nr:hypothetical protein [Hymenobacter sp.]